jgi:two-component system sensor histidine kinase BaeS
MFLVLSLAILTGSLIIGFSVNGLINAVYRRMTRNNLVLQSRMTARFAEEYYRHNGTLEGVDTALRDFIPEMLPQGRHMGRGPIPDHVMIIQDTDGMQRCRMGPPSGRDSRPEDRLVSIPLEFNGQTIGTLMVSEPPVFPPHAQWGKRTLLLINITVILFTLIIMALVLTGSGFFLKKNLSPVVSLTRAAGEMAGGNYDVRVPEAGAGEIRELVRQFNAMAEEVRKSEEWKRKMVADTAHELRTPVTLLLNRMEMIREGIYPVNEGELEALHRDISSMASLVENLQILHSAEEKRDTLAVSEIDAGRLLTEAAERFSAAAAEKRITVNTCIPESPVTVSVDAGKMEQVLNNLLSNAVDFTPEKGKVTLFLKASGDGTEISVEDSGPGITPEDREKIFERFYRVEKSRNRRFGGHGLGLAIVRALVRRHGGRVWVSPAEKGGTVFTVFLPGKSSGQGAMDPINQP